MAEQCDLHTHSVFSDGSYTPAQIINEAVEKGLSAVAICDHNTIDGVKDFLAAAEDKPIEAISGAEFSVEYNGGEVHLLGLFIPTEKLKEVSDLMQEVNRRKEESNLALVDSLRHAGYLLDYEEIKKNFPDAKISRVHVAAALVEKGYLSSINEAFHTLLSKKAGHYTEPKHLAAFETIVFLRKIGATPVLAHPFLNLSEEELEKFLPLAKEAGLVGVECNYSLFDEETTKKAKELTAKYGLLPSGGSDFHGTNKPSIQLGSGLGNLFVPAAYADALRP